MGSDIFTESAVAVEMVDFLHRNEIKKKANRELITNIFSYNGYIDKDAADKMIKNRDGFIDTFISQLSMEEGEYSSGYENDRQRNAIMIRTFCEHTGIDADDLPEWSIRIFDNNRETGYDICTDVLYIMFEPYGLFETKMTKLGQELAKTLQMDHITETTWTVHSY
tara:strand:+ start:692 stop:1189 length:498 start_codon:yes stop_codon:yes gene_type:complete